MAHKRSSQRGVVRAATSAILAAFGALLAMTGCSSDEGTGGGERLGSVSEAIACGKVVCNTDDCTVYKCSALNTCQLVSSQLDGSGCITNAGVKGVCASGALGGNPQCCTGCVTRLKGGGYACHPGDELGFCGLPGDSCANCNTGNTCNIDSCQKGQCVSDPVGDKNPCTDQSGVCWQGSCCSGCIDRNDACQPGSAATQCGLSTPNSGLVGCVDCSDGQACTVDSCDAAGKCAYAAAPDTTACPDATRCNGDETCKTGKCQPVANFSCDDSNACTAESCDPVTGCAYQKLTGTSCVDANKCNGDESCSAGTCMAGTPLNCNDNNVCTTDSCAAATGCSNVKQNGTSCADANKCNGAETCVTGVCTVGPPLDCDDKNPCTDDSCDAAAGCLHTAVAAGTKCETDNNVCNGISTCSGTTCTAGTALSCDDNNVCTDDSCVPATGCKFVNNTADCSDNNLCTQGDKCSAGACKGGAAPNCDDNEACTTDTCDVSKGCLHSATNEGGTCDDGNGCSTGDKCVAGKCLASGGKVCDDNNSCTQNTCDAAAQPQTCAFPKETDGTPCTFDKCHQNSTCTGGACSQGDLIDCDDANPCTTDSCDVATGCKHVADNAAVCSDGDLCTTADKCKSGVCVGTDVTCAPLDECHDAGTCNAKNGVCDDPRSTDGKDCKGGHCETGKCVPDPIGAGGAGGEGGMGAGGEGTAGTLAQGGEPPVTGTGGSGNETAVGGETGTEPTAGKAGSKATGGSTTANEGGAPEEDVHVFVRNPGGCSCTVPQSRPSNLTWLGGLALLGALARRRRARVDAATRNRRVS